ncbi:MAG TPA: hypothetical protein VND67_00070, partial [Acidimicrobiales bacterium]|nr:hypothetical protein [Acidimicrobiales bacterium]
ALVALVVGFGAMVPFMDTGLVVGRIAKELDGADLSFFVGFLVAGLVYYPLRRLAAHPDQPSDQPSDQPPEGPLLPGENPPDGRDAIATTGS